MSESITDRDLTEVSHLVAVSTTAETDVAARAAGDFCRDAVARLSSRREQRQRGRLHGALEISRAALQNEYPEVTFPESPNCEVCSSEDVNQRYCERIGEAIGIGDVAAASAAVLEFSERGLRSPLVEHITGIADAASVFVRTASAHSRP